MTTPIQPCLNCGAPIDDCPPETPFPYSLTGRSQFPTTLICPPGYDCAGAQTVSMICCDQTLSVSIPDSASGPERLLIVQRMIDNCRTVIGCTTGVPPNITDFFFSRTKSAGFSCPNDEGLFGQYTYTVPAGAWISPTQREADNLAQEQATNFANANHFCLKVPPLCPCALTAVNYTIPIVGGNPGFTASIASGHFPSGLVVSTSGRNLKITGTIRTMGTYDFTVRIQDSTRGILNTEITMHASQIGYLTTVATGFTAPAALSTVTGTVVATANVSVGDILSFSRRINGITTQEYGTMQVMAVDTPSGGDLTLKNLTVQPGRPIPAGTFVTWPLAALPEFEQGVPYSFQMPPGDLTTWAFNITAGTLPDGLTMSIDGLISGTPTGITGAVLNFVLLDPLCGIVDKTFYRPQIRLTGTSTKTTATILGYEEWAGFRSTPPKKYKTITWTGRSLLSSTSRAGSDSPTCRNGSFIGGIGFTTAPLPSYVYPVPGPITTSWGNWSPFGFSGIPQFLTGPASVVTPPDPFDPFTPVLLPESVEKPCASAAYIFEGAGTINDAGTQVSNYSVNRFVMCPRNPIGPPIFATIGNNRGFATLQGFCLPNEPCPTCATPPIFESNLATNNPSVDAKDFVTFGHLTGLAPVSSTFAQRIDGGFQQMAVNPPLPTNANISEINGLCAPWTDVTYDRNYSATLSDEYTDAIALSHAKVTHGNSVIAESLPRTTGFVSVWQSVVWKLTCSNLVFGEFYKVSIDFVTNLGVTTTHSETFTASSTTRVLTGNVPTPVDGQTITARNPIIAFVIT